MRATDNGGGLLRPSRESRVYLCRNGVNFGAAQQIARNNNLHTITFSFGTGVVIHGGESFGITARSRFANMEIAGIWINAVVV